MDSVEKNLLIGAFGTAALSMLSEAYFSYMVASGNSVAVMDKFPYQAPHPMLPPYDAWMALGGFPLLLYALGKGMKKDSLVQLSKGGAIYGVPQLAGITYIRVIGQTQATPATYRVVR